MSIWCVDREGIYQRGGGSTCEVVFPLVDVAARHVIVRGEGVGVVGAEGRCARLDKG